MSCARYCIIFLSKFLMDFGKYMITSEEQNVLWYFQSANYLIQKQSLLSFKYTDTYYCPSGTHSKVFSCFSTSSTVSFSRLSTYRPALHPQPPLRKTHTTPARTHLHISLCNTRARCVLLMKESKPIGCFLFEPVKKCQSH